MAIQLIFLKIRQKWKWLLGAITLLAGLWALSLCRPMPAGAGVDGMRLGGIPVWKAWQQVRALENEPLRVVLPEQTLTFSPEAYGVRLDFLGAVDAARRAGRDISLKPWLRADERKIREALQAYASQYDTDFRETRWTLSGQEKPLATDRFDAQAPGQTLTVTLGVPEAHLDVDGALSAILDAFSHPVSREGDRIEIPVVPERLPEQVPVNALAQELDAEPVNDTPDRKTGGICPGNYGRRLEKSALEEGLKTLKWGQTFTLPLTYPAPEILGEDALYQDVLGEYETKHNTNENRNNNLRLLCQALDGYVLRPGETFSYNQVVGERTRERGYLPAPAYSRNRLTDAVGGGVCQGSTTLYNCVLLADLEVVFRACHGAKVTYVPYGLDATVNYLTTDFRFRNQFHFPVKIQAEVTDELVKMKLLGTDEKDYYVKMQTSSGQDDLAVYARSYKCKYDKKTGELRSREIEAYSTYYKNIG